MGKGIVCSSLTRAGFIATALVFVTLAKFAMASNTNVGVSANDNGSNDSMPTSGTGTNAGFGFSAGWAAFGFDGNVSNDGTFTSSSTTINGNSGCCGQTVNIGSPNQAWGIYTNKGDLGEGASRSFSTGLSVGQSVSFDFDNGFIDNGKRVEVILSGSGGDRLDFGFTGGQSNYSIAIATGGNFAKGFSTDGFHVTLTLTGTNTYTATISTYNGTLVGTDTVTGTLGGTAGSAISSIIVKDNNGTTGNDHNFYTNNVSEYTPTVIAAGSLSSTSVYSGGASRVANAGGSLAFDGTAGGIVTNDSFNSLYNITFNGGNGSAGTNNTGTTNAASYTLTGNGTTGNSSVTLNGGVNNNSSNPQTINSNLKLGGSQTFAATSGDLSFGGTIDYQNTGSVILTTSGSNNVTFSGSFANVTNGSDVLKTTGTGIVTVSGDNSASTVNHLMFQVVSGTLSVASANNLGTPTNFTSYPDKVVFGDSSGTNTGTLKITNTFSFGAAGGNPIGFSIDKTAATTGNTAIIDVTGSNTFTLNGAIQDLGSGTTAGQFQKADTGTLILTANNTYTGATSVNGGILKLANGSGQALSGGGAITVNSSGTLLMGANNQVATSASIKMSGGTLDAGGFSQGTGGAPTTPNSGTVGIGALTLNSSSTIDLTGTSVLHFANSNSLLGNSSTWSGTLSIWDWSGTAATGGGAEQILFGGDVTGLSSAQLAEIQFYSGAGTGAFATGAVILADGEIVPVPEPSTWAAAALAAAVIGYMSRRSLAAAGRRWISCRLSGAVANCGSYRLSVNCWKNE